VTFHNACTLNNKTTTIRRPFPPKAYNIFQAQSRDFANPVGFFPYVKIKSFVCCSSNNFANFHTAHTGRVHHMGMLHIAVIPLLLLHLFANAYTQRPTLNDVSTIINSYGRYCLLCKINLYLNLLGYWKLRLPERFIRNQILPFIQQFRRQLNPQTEIVRRVHGKNKSFNF
jgi:hypothetical protein